MSSCVQHKFDNIIKSPEDDRFYRGLVLENGLKIMLVSDPSTDKSAAAMDVNIGHMVDPKELPGLAHFCEHMLFLGTEKYTDENEYSKFLSQNGGGSNAYTSSDHTNYYFDISPKSLPGALDRFSQFFLCPLFTESATDREVMAVNSEHEKNVPSDAWRIKQLEHSLADPKHDYFKFGTGNKETLDTQPKASGLSVRDGLLKFHEKWYSSNIMCFAVLGKESLDELETMVLELFQGVKNKDVQVPEWKDHPYLDQDHRTITYVVPVKDIRSLHITFPVPDLHPHYKTAPGHYIGHLIGHEGKGSLLSELKSRGWSNSLVGGQKSGSKGFGFFVVNVDLTVEGMDHVDEIVDLVFQYLRMMKHVGPLEWVFDECKHIYEMQFRFKDKERPQSFVTGLASTMQDYPMEEALNGGYILSEWKPELISETLDLMVPDKVRIMVIAQKFEDRATETEKWYGTKYLTESIPKTTLESWESGDINPNLAVPVKNEFIPTNFELVKREEDNPKFPLIVRETGLSRLWFKQDDEFLRPKASLQFEIQSPVAYITPNFANLTYMFVQLLKDSLNEYTYDAELAGLYYSLSNTKYGVKLSIRGYNQKQHVLLDKVVNKMLSFEVDKERFKVFKESYQRGLENFKMEQPHQHAIYYNSVLLAERVWEKQELLDALEDMEADDVQKFIPLLLAQLHIESLMHGNLTEEEAIHMMESMESKFKTVSKTKPLSKTQLMRDREIQLENGSNCFYKTENNVHKSSCIEIYYQCGQQSTRDNMLLELFAQVINEACFDTLRTKEQLGYIVFSGIRRACGMQGLRVIVQSERHPLYLNSRIENFLALMEDKIRDMEDKDFEEHKTALADKRLEKPKQLSSRTAKFWGEISSEQLFFERDEVEVSELRKLTKEDVLKFYNEFISVKGEKRSKLSCYVLSMLEDGGAGKTEVDKDLEGLCLEDKVEVLDPHEFRMSNRLCPMLKPYVDVETLKKKKSK